LTTVKGRGRETAYLGLGARRDTFGAESTVNIQIGHNSQDVFVKVEVRLFNSITKYADAEGLRRELSLPAGTTVGELADQLRIPRDELFLVLVNGRDVTPGLVGDGIKDYHLIEDGDVVAFSGAVPYSYGYGAPVV
jgi:hypothetical protein